MPFDDIKDKIYPWIKVVYEPEEQIPNSTVQVDLDEEEDQPLMKRWLGNLAIFYVEDQTDSFNLLLQRDLPQNFTLQELHNIATANLERDVEFNFNATDFGGYGLTAGGDHEAGSLCLAGVWEWCSDQIEADLIVAVPAKDLVLMVPANDIGKINLLKTFVTKIFKEGERLLTKQLYHFDKTNGNWTLWGQAD